MTAEKPRAWQTVDLPLWKFKVYSRVHLSPGSVSLAVLELQRGGVVIRAVDLPFSQEVKMAEGEMLTDIRRYLNGEGDLQETPFGSDLVGFSQKAFASLPQSARQHIVIA